MEIMRCTECGYQNENGENTCSKCGTVLTNSTAGPEEIRKEKTITMEGTPTIKGENSVQPSWDSGSKVSEASRDFFRCGNCQHYPLKHSTSSDHPCPNCGHTGMDVQSTGTKTRKLENFNFGAEPHQIKLTEIRSNTTKSFEGEKISLGRDNLDSGNLSISTRHADLEYKNGTWFIKDASSNQATFVQVLNGGAPISNGSKILIGNKVFTVNY